jgi:hypothetical protein
MHIGDNPNLHQPGYYLVYEVKEVRLITLLNSDTEVSSIGCFKFVGPFGDNEAAEKADIHNGKIDIVKVTKEGTVKWLMTSSK